MSDTFETLNVFLAENIFWGNTTLSPNEYVEQ